MKAKPLLTQEDLLRLKKNYTGFSEQILGERLYSKQKGILNACSLFNKVAIKSGHGVGKSRVAANLAIDFLFLNAPSKVITTAPTARQVYDILWSEINTLYVGARYPLGGKCLTTQIQITPDWFATGFTIGKDRQSLSEAFQGYHSENLLIIFDEAPGVLPAVWTAKEGILTSKNCKFLAIGNPIKPNDDFGKCFKDDSFFQMTIPAWESPNVTGEMNIPGLTEIAWIEDKRKRWGEGSPLWLSKVAGEFPEETENVLIPLSKINQALIREVEPVGITFTGVDVARYGEDSSVIIDLSSNNVMIGVKELTKHDTMTLVGHITNNQASRKSFAIGIDIIGIGSGVFDRCEELRGDSTSSFRVTQLEPVNVAEAPEDKEKFAGLRDELWWNLREEFVNGNITIQDTGRMIEDLSDIRYGFTSKGQIKIESKEEMKRRGKRSPDFAEALAIALYMKHKQDTGDNSLPIANIVGGTRYFR